MLLVLAMLLMLHVFNVHCALGAIVLLVCCALGPHRAFGVLCSWGLLCSLCSQLLVLLCFWCFGVLGVAMLSM
jgi:hypothetical protein